MFNKEQSIIRNLFYESPILWQQQKNKLGEISKLIRTNGLVENILRHSNCQPLHTLVLRRKGTADILNIFFKIRFLCQNETFFQVL